MSDPVSGLLLGIIGVIVPTYQIVQAISQRISDIKNFPKKLRNINRQIGPLKNVFESECRFLFPQGTDDVLVQQMLSNENHPMWKDREFQNNFIQHLGGESSTQSLRGLFAMIQETFEQLESEIAKATVEKGSKAGTLTHAKGLYRKLQRPSEVPAMDELLSSLRATIGDFRTLRMQRDAIQKRRYRPTEIKSSFGVEIMADQLPAVMEMQKASKRVYAAIASVAHCSCHRFYFRLQCETPEKSEKQSFGDSSDFRLVLTNGGGESMISCICIAVRKEGASTPEAYPPPPSYSTFPKQEAATAVAINKKQKQLRFTDNSPSPTTSSLNTILTDLCSTVRSLHSAPSYLGALPITDPHRHIFTESVKPSICRISLPRVFERAPLSRTRSILPPKRRYRLAWVLSASLLRFGFSTNWFRENWRSGDIYFLQDEDPSTLDSPHISVRFSSSSSSPISSGTCLAKNEQLYSLAIALIEIGYGDTLQNLITEGDKGCEEWNHAREYAGAKELMENIGQVMSRRYAMVVRRCFYCSFAIDEGDLTPQKLQRAYYEKVECELRGCMNEFG